MYKNKRNSILEASLQEFFQLLFLKNPFERWTFDTISKMNLRMTSCLQESTRTYIIADLFLFSYHYEQRIGLAAQHITVR